MAMTSRYRHLFFNFFKVRYTIEWVFHVMHRDVYNNNYILYYDFRIALPFLVQCRPHPLSTKHKHHARSQIRQIMSTGTHRSTRTFENVISPRSTTHIIHTHIRRARTCTRPLEIIINKALLSFFKKKILFRIITLENEI